MPATGTTERPTGLTHEFPDTAPAMDFTPRPLSESEDWEYRQGMTAILEQFPGPVNTVPRCQALDEMARRYGQQP